MSESYAVSISLTWTLSVAGHPAKTSPPPTQKPQVSKDLAPASGESSSGSSMSAGHGGSSGRTSTPPGSVGCPLCGALCGDSGMPACLFACEPVKLAQGISEPAASSSHLPTLSSSYGTNQGGAAGRTGPVRPSLQQLLPTLVVEADKQRHPGPNGHPDKLLLPTLQAHHCHHPETQPGERRGVELEGLLRQQELLPTTTTRDWRSGKASEATHDRNSRPLNEVLSRGTEQSLLSPLFLEVFMGFPETWTEIEPNESAR